MKIIFLLSVVTHIHTHTAKETSKELYVVQVSFGWVQFERFSI